MPERKRALIVVDMSNEQVAELEYHRTSVIEHCRQLIASAHFDLVLDSRLWLESPTESTLSRVWPGTGVTLFKAGSQGAALIDELVNNRLVFVRKYNYSSLAPPSKLPSILEEHSIDEVVICGINTDYCVFATALDCFALGYTIQVVEDAVSTVRGQAAHEEGLGNLQRHFGADVLVKTKDLVGMRL